MDFILFIRSKISIPIANLLSSRFDNYVLYALLLGVLFLVFFGIALLIKKDKLLLPFFFIAVVLTSTFLFLREFSPWSQYFGRAPRTKAVPAIELILPKLGEATTNGEGTIAVPA